MCLRFSIVIPTYRRPGPLEECLNAILCLSYPKSQFEVIVVSDEPSRGTEEIVARYAASLQVRSILQDHRGPASARNAGAAASSAPWLLFLDDDCAPFPDWLCEWERHTSLHPKSASGGTTVNALPENLYSTASYDLVEFVQGWFHAGHAERSPFLASNNLCVPAECFRAIRGFSTVFPLAAAEDRDFCDRWSAEGWPTSRAARAKVLHAHELSLTRFWRQHCNYGRGAFELRRQRSARNQPSPVEPMGFYLEMLRYPWRHASSGRAALVSALICLAQAANAAGFLAEWGASWRKHPRA